MEEVREIARLQYEIAGAEVKCEAVKFFSSMDSDGDGKVSIQEMWSFMMEQGFPPHFRNLKFFTLLDSDASGALTFDEVRTLFYIITTGRPCCSNCSLFIAGTFFSCPDCPTFHLCLNCFRDAQPRHHIHDGRRVHFLDTYAYLQTLRSRQSQRPQPTPSPPIAPVEYGQVSMHIYIFRTSLS